MNVMINLVVICTAILMFIKNPITINAVNRIPLRTIGTLLALETQNYTYEFGPDGPMKYCGCFHSRRKRYIVTHHKLHTKGCGIHIVATPNEYGQWRCYIGGITGPEEERAVDLRVAGPLAAMTENDITNKYSRTNFARYTFYITGQNGYRHIGHKLHKKGCGIHIVTKLKDSEKWRCYIGEIAGLEEVDTVNLRVVRPLAAMGEYVIATEGQSVELECKSVNVTGTLLYCRFKPPKDHSFSIDESVTHSRAIMNRYSFPEHKSLRNGNCAVIIHKVGAEDRGNWTCTGGLINGNEYSDVITLDIETDDNSAINITIFAIGVITFLFGIGWGGWKYRRSLGTMISGPSEENLQELEEMPRIPGNVYFLLNLQTTNIQPPE